MGKREVLWSAGFYLAGGTGLALQLGHRISEDLDFFSERDFDPEATAHKIAGILPVQVQSVSEGTLHLICNKTRVSLLHYPYKVVFPFLCFEGCPVADYRDIAAMKLFAVGQRGFRKDFVDLYFSLCKSLSLDELKQIIDRKCVNVRYNWVHLVRSLGYFADAEKDPMPELVTPHGPRKMTLEEWEEVKRFFLGLQEKALSEMRHHGVCPKGVEASKRPEGKKSRRKKL
ncbi:hypothetical protein DXX99_07915 [Ammonifex thiophilus]|uniref:Nucleotidyl transferase AbiEii/AbiGii toxin family protein n=1 Tax=Ammonifex thiophilus TaxID=444093 RepID=A0A3D8P423_9THEO|nr:hypothetical protein DXX99_07915 [Ammonifex thiophilus]